MILLIIKALYFMLPAYIANMAPVLLKNQLHSLNKPIDNNKTWKGKRILGSHKTWRGLIGGAILGILTIFIQKILFINNIFNSIALIDYAQYSLLLGLLLGFGALVGDSVKSFFKRRVNVAPGKPWIPFDQLDFVIGSLLFASFVYLPNWKILLIIILITPILHMLVNHISFWMGLQKEKW